MKNERTEEDDNMNIVNEYGIIGIYYICVNVIAFILYGLDKKYAREGRWRIPEKTLLGIALIGGAAGAWIGMQTFRHKSKHMSFRMLVPLFAVVHMLMIVRYTNLI